METQFCKRCQTQKSIEDFYLKWANKTERQSQCKACCREKGKEYHLRNINARHDQQQEWYRRRVLEDPEWHLKKRAARFHITLDEARRIWKDNKCAICGIGEREGKGYLVFDHSHQKKNIRGLLCNCCNWMLGHAKDNPSILRKGADYLEATQVS